MKKILLTMSTILLAFVIASQAQDIIRDIEGNEYPTVGIGRQVWMAANLKTTKYNDGYSIPLITDNIEWSRTLTPAYTWYNFDKEMYKKTYGALYNWYAVNTGKLCPLGWHVPTEAEWSELTDYLGGKTIAGGKLKIASEDKTGMDRLTNDPNNKKELITTSTGVQSLLRWYSPNTGATNESGFSAIPGGQRQDYVHNVGTFSHIGTHGYWWTATDSSPGVAWFRLLYYNYSHLSRFTTGKRYGFSVRCVKD